MGSKTYDYETHSFRHNEFAAAGRDGRSAKQKNEVKKQYNYNKVYLSIGIRYAEPCKRHDE
jgi:hypothetical protein